MNHESNIIKRLTHAVLLAVMLLSSIPVAWGQGQNDTAAAKDDDFVIASVIMADPGAVLYSRVGHMGLHMVCPDYGLDYVFSYESENVRHKVLSFLAGKLKMGMFAIPTEEYLSGYRTEGRGVREYRLNLPIHVKQELWRILDNHMLAGANLPYDYLTHGCAHSTLMMLREALDSIPIDYGEWPERFRQLNRRELTGRQLAKDSPWTWFFLNLITNGSINYDCSLEDKLIMPADLLEMLQQSRVQGQILLGSEARVLVDGKPCRERMPVSPLAVSLILLALAMLCLFLRKGWMDYVLLSLQCLLGIVTLYLTFFSSLCCTEWSWLIVPFNPLPLLLWKWRKAWALPYAAILAVWIVFMLAWPHSLTDWPYIVLAASLIVSYINIHRNKTAKNIQK